MPTSPKAFQPDHQDGTRPGRADPRPNRKQLLHTHPYRSRADRLWLSARLRSSGHLPFQTGSLFSLKARMPSGASSVQHKRANASFMYSKAW